jgi:hypothetical protein
VPVNRFLARKKKKTLADAVFDRMLLTAEVNKCILLIIPFGMYFMYLKEEINPHG